MTKYVVDIWKKDSNRTVLYGRGSGFVTFGKALEFAEGKGEVTIRPEKGDDKE